MRVGSRTIELSNTDKVFFPKRGYTKGDVIDYYNRIADAMLPHLKDHLLVMQRFPDGLEGEGWIHKEIPEYFPDWIAGETVRNQDGTTTRYVVCNNRATLVYLANQACLTPHLWLSRRDKLDYPDRMIFDLDPPGEFRPARRLALELRDLLEEMGLAPFAMTTGSRGLHVVVPLTRRESFDEVRDFARSVAQLLARRHPDEVTVEVRKAKRGNRVFIDVARNAFGQTAVAPYAVRALPEAPVAVPVGWDEVEQPSLQPQKYNIENVFGRLDRRGDVWEGMHRHARSLVKARQELARLV